MKVENVLVLGGAGFIGRHLVAELARGVIKVTVPPRRRERAKPLIQLPTVEVLEADVTAPGVLQRLAAGRDAVINLIGILHSRRGRRDERGPHDYGPDFARLHVELPQAVVAACRAVGVKRLLHMSALGAAPQAPHHPAFRSHVVPARAADGIGAASADDARQLPLDAGAERLRRRLHAALRARRAGARGRRALLPRAPGSARALSAVSLAREALVPSAGAPARGACDRPR